MTTRKTWLPDPDDYTPTWADHHRCTRCDWFCFGLDTITDADRVLDAHHQAHHVHPDHRTQEASTAA